MNMELDKELLEDLISQIDEQYAIVDESIKILDKDITKNESYTECGQVADRLYGAIAMFDTVCAEYLGKLKEMCYKVPSTDPSLHDIRKKSLGFIKGLHKNLQTFKTYFSANERPKAISQEFEMETKRVDKFLKSALGSVETKSVAFEDTRTYVYVYDKSSKIESNYKMLNQELFPSPKFYNVLLGFKKAVEKDIDTVEAVIISEDSPSWTVGIQDLRKAYPDMIIIFCAANKKAAQDADKESLNVQSVIYSGTKYQKIISIIEKSKAAKMLDSAPSEPTLSTPAVAEPKSIDTTESPAEPVQTDEYSPILSPDENYFAIPVTDFKEGQLAPFDVHIKLSEGHYVRVFQTKDCYDSQQIEKHADKQVSHYYVDKAEYEKYIENINSEVKKLCSDSKADISEHKVNISSHAEKTLNFIEQNGIDEKAINYAKNFVESSEHLVSDLLGKNENLRGALEDIGSLEHSSALCLISGIFLQKMDANIDLQNDITLMCFLHDIALAGSSKALKSENVEAMNDKEKEKFYVHSKVGARLIAEQGIKVALVEAVNQHHARIDGSGFPELGPNEQFNPIAEFIGMCEEFLLTVDECEKKGTDPIPAFQERMKGRFSERLQKIFESVWKDAAKVEKSA